MLIVNVKLTQSLNEAHTVFELCTNLCGTSIRHDLSISS
jgi:hypothetical protein